MEFAIPISRFQSSYVKWGLPRNGPFRRTIPFGYEENNMLFNNLIIILHPLKVVEIDHGRNQLILEESSKIPFLTRLEQFQLNVSNELERNSAKWVDASKIPEIVRSPLQPWLKSKRITLFLSAEPASLNFFTQDGPAVFSDTTVKPGDMIRAVVKIQGLSLQMSEHDAWTGKSRIQHHVLQLYKVSNCD